jgi:predicted MFS family arabinose efflux permease
MKVGITALILGYMLSQFYRAFLAVLTPVLKTDLGATPEDFSTASGLWFLAFTLMQIPGGWALDRIGPRWTASTLLLFGAAGGAMLFATATTPFDLKLAMALIGIGCSPILTSSYFIFARMYSPAIFGTLAGALIGIGSLGNIAGSLPLAAAANHFGWRETVTALAIVTAIIALAIAILVRDPPRTAGPSQGSLLDLLRMPALWLILPMMAVNYAPVAALRGLWVGPYYTDVFGANADGIGQVTLIMGLAMVAGNFAYGVMDRIFGTRKWVVLIGNLAAATCLLALWAMPTLDGWPTVALLAGVGLFGASFPMVMAHGRAFVPAHLMGRGVTLLNLFGIGFIGIAQFATGRLHAALPSTPPETPYAAIFLFFAVLLLLGTAIYAFSKDRTD